MDQHSHYGRLLASLAVMGLVSFAATTASAATKTHDASRKSIRTTSVAKAPIGTFGNGIDVPMTLNSQSPFATDGNRNGSIHDFGMLGGKKNMLKSVPMRIAPTAPLRACVTYDIDKQSYGIVNVTASGLEVLREHEGLQAGWGGAGVGTQYYFNVCAEVTGGYVSSVETYLWDTSTWTCIGYDQDPSLSVLSYSMTSDPVTETIYGCFFSEDLQQIEIGTLDALSMKRTGVIGKAEKPLYAMGFSSDGTLYGIDSSGVLYTINLENAQYTKVADTGIKTQYNTAGTVDHFNDVFYYAACPKGPSDNPSQDWALYSIDLKNGYNVEKCWDLNAELGGMYMANDAAKPFAPAAPVLNAVNFTDGNLTGSVDFTAPTTAFDGSSLNGSLNYGILANDKVIAKGAVNSGENKSIDITLPDAGMYTIRVFVSNTEGDSPKSQSVTRWFGNGRPLMPEGLKTAYSYGDNQIMLSWDAVTSTVNDGYMDNADVTYTVTRTIDDNNPTVIADKIAATEIVDAVDSADGFKIYRYTVVANHKEQTSAPAMTDYVAVGAIVPPFAPDFTSPMSIGYFTTKDYLNRGSKWTYTDYDEAIQLIWNNGWMSTNMDVALITAPLKLEAGKAYEISYNAWVESNYVYGIGLQWGTDLSNLETIIEPVSISASNSSYYTPLHQSTMVTAPADGIYYFSVRTLANSATTCKILLNDFTISQGLSVKAPGLVTDVTLTPPYDGSRKLDVSFKTPTTTIKGGNLASLSKIEVYRDGQLVKTFNDPSVGQMLSFTDNGTENKDVAYTITAFSADGTGKTWYGTAHMGVNMPVSPVDCKIVQDMTNPGMVTVSWTPVAKDINGYEFDPSLLRYAIFASDYSTMITNNITASQAKATFRAVQPNSGQRFVWYCVVPYTEGGVNGYVGGFGTTPMIPVGTPFSMPYLESFATGGLTYPMGQEGSQVRIANGISSQHLTIGTQDDDNGNIAWYTAPGSTIDLYTANIYVEDEDDVAMSFYYTGVPDMDGYTILPYVISEGKKYPLCDEINTSDCAEKGWNSVTLSLAAFKGKPVQIGFHVLCVMNNFGFGIDNIKIKRFYANDLRMGELSGPSYLTTGKAGEIIAQIINDGSKDAPAEYVVDLYAGGKLVDTVEGVPVEAYGSGVVKFNRIPDPFENEKELFYTGIRWAADEDNTNNESNILVVPIRETVYPGVTDLSAKITEDYKTVNLEWTEPDYTPKMREVTDSFEDYKPFTLVGFGDWKVIDVDGAETYTLGIPTDADKAPKAWIVIEPSTMRMYYEGTHSGEKAIAAVSTRQPSDDWLISPELSGQAQKVSFFAATAPEDYGCETFEFYYSTGGTQPEDFIQLGDAVEVPEGKWGKDEYGDRVRLTTWYEYSYDLPEGAKHFAIRYVSHDIFALLIDDITYTVSDDILSLQGYNLYRNRVKINDEPMKTVTFADDASVLADGDYTYAVETVYDKGNSGISNQETVNKPKGSGIDGIFNAEATVTVENGEIVIRHAAGKKVTVSNAAGMVIRRLEPSGAVRIAVEPGIYMVTVNKTTHKVIVK